VTPADLHDFFVASAGVAGALVGLLFVAMTVAGERIAAAPAHRVRAAAAMTAFTNALAVSLFGLVPGEKLGGTAAVVAVVGLAFVAAALLSLVRAGGRSRPAVRDALSLTGLAATFAIELIQGLDLLAHPRDAGAARTIAILVVVCFLIGIARAWELIGGPTIGMGHELSAAVRGDDRPPDGRDA
jgi:hypothetical protein